MRAYANDWWNHTDTEPCKFEQFVSRFISQYQQIRSILLLYLRLQNIRALWLCVLEKKKIKFHN